MVLFFGRPTLGFVIDLLPGGGDLFLRRFINGVHLAALYLAGLGLMFLVNLLMGLLRRWKLSPKPVIAIAVVVAALLVTPAVIERVSYERQGGRWIDEQARFEATDGVGYEALVERDPRPGSRQDLLRAARPQRVAVPDRAGADVRGAAEPPGRRDRVHQTHLVPHVSGRVPVRRRSIPTCGNSSEFGT